MSVGTPVVSLSLSPAMEMLATAHINRRGIYLWANQLVFGAGTSITPSETPVKARNIYGYLHCTSSSQMPRSDAYRTTHRGPYHIGSSTASTGCRHTQNHNSLLCWGCPQETLYSIVQVRLPELRGGGEDEGTDGKSPLHALEDQGGGSSSDDSGCELEVTI